MGNKSILEHEVADHVEALKKAREGCNEDNHRAVADATMWNTRHVGATEVKVDQVSVKVDELPDVILSKLNGDAPKPSVREGFSAKGFGWRFWLDPVLALRVIYLVALLAIMGFMGWIFVTVQSFRSTDQATRAEMAAAMARIERQMNQ